MEKLKTYLFDLPVIRREEFAHRCGTSWPFLRNIAYGYKTAGEKLCVRIELESAGAVTRKDLRTDWFEIWPELKELHMPNTPDPKPDDRIPIGPPDCITKGGAHV